MQLRLQPAPSFRSGWQKAYWLCGGIAAASPVSNRSTSRKSLTPQVYTVHDFRPSTRMLISSELTDCGSAVRRGPAVSGHHLSHDQSALIMPPPIAKGARSQLRRGEEVCYLVEKRTTLRPRAVPSGYDRGYRHGRPGEQAIKRRKNGRAILSRLSQRHWVMMM
jgi:hypothetical protein